MRSIISFWTRTSLVLKIFVGLIIGMLLGLVVPQLAFIAIPGTLFISALKAMAPILVAVLVASALSKASSGLGKRFRTVITFYISTTLLAALVAVIVSFLFPVEIALRTTSAISAPCSLTDVLGNMMHKLTDNPVRCLTEANYIGILFWATIVGLGLKMKASERTISVVGDLAEVISTVIRWIIQFAPFGIMGIVFSSVAESGLEVFTTYGRLLCLLVGGMLFSALVINPILVGTSLRANPFPPDRPLPEAQCRECLLHPQFGRQHSREYGDMPAVGPRPRLLLREHSPGCHYQYARGSSDHHGYDLGRVPYAGH